MFDEDGAKDSSGDDPEENLLALKLITSTLMTTLGIIPRSSGLKKLFVTFSCCLVNSMLPAKLPGAMITRDQQVMLSKRTIAP